MPRRPAHLDTLDHLTRRHAETHAPVTADQLAEATGRSSKTIYNHVSKLKGEGLIVAPGDSTYEPMNPAPVSMPESLDAPPTLPPSDAAPADRAAAVDAEADQARARIKTLKAEQRDALEAHGEASASYMNGTGSTAHDVQAAAGLVDTIGSTVRQLEARLDALADEGRQIAREIQREGAISKAAQAAKDARAASADYLDRFGAALPAVLDLAHGILEASDRWHDACTRFLEAGHEAGLPPLDEAEVTVTTTGKGGVVSTQVVPSAKVAGVLGLVLDRLASDLSIPEAEAALAAAQEGHRLGDAPLTRDLHHTPLWTRKPATQPPGGEASRLLVRSLIDLALEADQQT